MHILASYAPKGSVWLRCILRNVEFWTKVKAKGNPGAQDDEGGHLRGSQMVQTADGYHQRHHYVWWEARKEELKG